MKTVFNPDNISLEILGYTNSIGKKEYNSTLSKKRALAVKDYFSNYKVHKVMGLGELPVEEALARKVNIIIHPLDTIKNSFTHPLVSIEKNSILDVSLKEEKKSNEKRIDEYEVDDLFVLKNIHFYSGTDVIKRDSKPQLNELFRNKLEKKSKNQKIKIIDKTEQKK